ncbi:carbon-nitrogen hydrolase family protein [Gallaecimonas sp. GXIMD4217]|uniref:carbon-nitrogen hydrolase family protein n=1 Tax=Gallaecimonas sp. GXIMD4217 TaxID=3131927 RepID=UPI00311B0DBA
MSELTVLQMVSVPDVNANLDFVEQQLSAMPREPRLVVLPECFACFGGKDRAQLAIAEPFGEGPIQKRLADMARRHGLWLVSGTLPIQSADPDRFFAASLLFDDQGQIRARFDKMHLFDVKVADNTGTYAESATTVPGHAPTVVDTPFGRLGMAVCYDIRFAELFAFYRQAQVDILVLPAAFTAKTGQAHWEVLCRARAIEGQCWLLGANQGGSHANGRETWGHSMIVNPWGEVVAELGLGPGQLSTSLDERLAGQIRQAMPVDKHRRFTLTPPDIKEHS